MKTKDGAAVASAVAGIRSRITGGDLSIGQQVRQEEAALVLGMSRAPVREALRVLADQGLLEHRVHVGYFVRERSHAELGQLFVMLSFLETKVMESIEEPTVEALARLVALNEELSSYVDAEDWSPGVELNRRFHFEIFRLSPLEVMIEKLERLWLLAEPFSAQKYRTSEARRVAVDEHWDLLEALSPLDVDRAVELQAKHLRRHASDETQRQL